MGEFNECVWSRRFTLALEVQGDGTGSEIRVLASEDGHFEAPFEDLGVICYPMVGFTSTHFPHRR